MVIVNYRVQDIRKALRHGSASVGVDDGLPAMIGDAAALLPFTVAVQEEWTQFLLGGEKESGTCLP